MLPTQRHQDENEQVVDAASCKEHKHCLKANYLIQCHESVDWLYRDMWEDEIVLCFSDLSI